MLERYTAQIEKQNRQTDRYGTEIIYKQEQYMPQKMNEVFFRIVGKTA